MRRVLVFDKYRNIGFDKKETLILNRTMEHGKMGGLVIIIGPNNSGKSNILDGISSIGKKLTDRDVTELSFKDEDRRPSIKLELVESSKMLPLIEYNSSVSEVKISNNIRTEEYTIDDISEFKNIFKFLLEKHGLYNYLYIKEFFDSLDGKENVNDLLSSICDFMSRRIIPAVRSGNTIYGSFYKELKSTDNKIVKFILINNSNLEELNTYCKGKFGTPFFNKVIRYEENAIGKNDLVCNIDKIKQSQFFKTIFKFIDLNINDVINAYTQFSKFSNPVSLQRIEKIINDKIESLSKEFNDLYFTNNDKYYFTISLSPNKNLMFGISRGKEKDPLMLEYQSTGFRWFFNLFFNFLGSSELEAGDIIIMDEPATNLHPQGQVELRRFIKEFGKKNDLTFVIATHMPFLIDCDNFDELRVVSCENNRSRIDNIFTAVNSDDPDSLKPIKESLTIKQNVLYDIDTEVVWVEGITDYNYLTMFKNLLEIKNIAFLPFNGVRSNDADQIKLIQNLSSIKLYKFSILVDGDKAGLAMVRNCKNTKFEKRIHNLSELNDSNDKKIRVIEDLFSDNDRNKFQCLKLNDDNPLKKSSNQSSIMKENCSLNDFDDLTIENFKSLFNMLTQ